MNTLTILRKQAKVVGVDWDEFVEDNDTKNSDWYRQHTWTTKQEQKFKDWLIKYLMKTEHMSKKFAERESSMWLLAYGWMTKD